MPSEWYFYQRGENTNVIAVICSLAGLDESGFGKMHFVGYVLHFLIGKSAGVCYYCKLVSTVFGLSKHINYIEGVVWR